MKQLKFTVLLAATFLFAASANAQTADDIISKYIDAIGGKDLLTSINSIHEEASMQAMGNESPTNTTLLNGKGIRTEAEMMGNKMVSVYTDKGGWAINPMMGSSDPAAMPDEQYKAGEDQIYFSPLLNYAANGAKVELQGQEKVGDANAYKIKYTNKDGMETTYYIDATSYYLVKVEKTITMMGQDVDMTVAYSDFKKADNGVVMPYTSEVNYGPQFSMTLNVKKIDFNPTVDPTIFDMPSK